MGSDQSFPIWSASLGRVKSTGKLVRTALELDKANHIADPRMGDLEGQSNLYQATERPRGRAMNPGVPKSSGPRKGRKSKKR